MDDEQVVEIESEHICESNGLDGCRAAWISVNVDDQLWRPQLLNLMQHFCPHGVVLGKHSLLAEELLVELDRVISDFNRDRPLLQQIRLPSVVAAVHQYVIGQEELWMHSHDKSGGHAVDISHGYVERGQRALQVGDDVRKSLLSERRTESVHEVVLMLPKSVSVLAPSVVVALQDACTGLIIELPKRHVLHDELQVLLEALPCGSSALDL